MAEERLSTEDYGNVIYRFKKAWDDGTTALKLAPMELMKRLVGLVPRRRIHLTLSWRAGPTLQTPKTNRSKTTGIETSS